MTELDIGAEVFRDEDNGLSLRQEKKSSFFSEDTPIFILTGNDDSVQPTTEIMLEEKLNGLDCDIKQSMKNSQLCFDEDMADDCPPTKSKPQESEYSLPVKRLKCDYKSKMFNSEVLTNQSTEDIPSIDECSCQSLAEEDKELQPSPQFPTFLGKRLLKAPSPRCLSPLGLNQTERLREIISNFIFNLTIEQLDSRPQIGTAKQVFKDFILPILVEPVILPDKDEDWTKGTAIPVKQKRFDEFEKKFLSALKWAIYKDFRAQYKELGREETFQKMKEEIGFDQFEDEDKIFDKLFGDELKDGLNCKVVKWIMTQPSQLLFKYIFSESTFNIVITRMIEQSADNIKTNILSKCKEYLNGGWERDAENNPFKKPKSTAKPKSKAKDLSCNEQRKHDDSRVTKMPWTIVEIRSAALKFIDKFIIQAVKANKKDHDNEIVPETVVDWLRKFRGCIIKNEHFKGIPASIVVDEPTRCSHVYPSSVFLGGPLKAIPNTENN